MSTVDKFKQDEKALSPIYFTVDRIVIFSKPEDWNALLAIFWILEVIVKDFNWGQEVKVCAGISIKVLGKVTVDKLGQPIKMPPCMVLTEFGIDIVDIAEEAKAELPINDTLLGEANVTLAKLVQLIKASGCIEVHEDPIVILVKLVQLLKIS